MDSSTVYLLMPKIHYTRFPQNFTVHGEAANLLRTSCGLVSDTANKSATSWQQVVVMEFGKRHDKTDIKDFCQRQLFTGLLGTCRLCCGPNLLWTCYGEVANLLRTCYGETGVMDFGLNTATIVCCFDCLWALGHIALVSKPASVFITSTVYYVMWP